MPVTNNPSKTSANSRQSMSLENFFTQHKAMQDWTPGKNFSSNYDGHHPLWSGWLTHQITEVFCGRYGLSETQMKFLSVLVQAMLNVGLNFTQAELPLKTPDGDLQQLIQISLVPTQNILDTEHVIESKAHHPLDVLKEIGETAGKWYSIAENAKELQMNAEEKHNFMTIGSLANRAVQTTWPKLFTCIGSQIKGLVYTTRKKYLTKAVEGQSEQVWLYRLPAVKAYIIKVRYAEKLIDGKQTFH